MHYVCRCMTDEPQLLSRTVPGHTQITEAILSQMMVPKDNNQVVILLLLVNTLLVFEKVSKPTASNQAPILSDPQAARICLHLYVLRPRSATSKRSAFANADESQCEVGASPPDNRYLISSDRHSQPPYHREGLLMLSVNFPVLTGCRVQVNCSGVPIVLVGRDIVALGFGLRQSTRDISLSHKNDRILHLQSAYIHAQGVLHSLWERWDRRAMLPRLMSPRGATRTKDNSNNNDNKKYTGTMSGGTHPLGRTPIQIFQST